MALFVLETEPASRITCKAMWLLSWESKAHHGQMSPYIYVDCTKSAIVKYGDKKRSTHLYKPLSCINTWQLPKSLHTSIPVLAYHPKNKGFAMVPG